MDTYLGENIRWILCEFERRDIEYAVLRNYEKLPEIGHDLDLITNKENLGEINEVLEKCKDIFKWDEYIKINLWKSYVSDFSIHVFKLFNYEKNKCLHIDFFGGHSIWSAPAFSLKDLLDNRIKVDFYYKINAKHEIVIRSMQLACAIRDNEDKRVKKLKNILNRLEKEVSVNEAYKSLPISISHDFYYQKGQSFQDQFVKYKHTYFLKYFTRAPFKIIYRFLERIRFRLKMYTLSIPGVLICMDSNSLKKHKHDIKTELETLKIGSIISNFEIVDSFKFSELITYYKKLLMQSLVVIPVPYFGVKYNNKLIKKKIVNRFSR
tara:strand:- start:433 stop:1398 length:966 start_codon:yes stop_codon:yes gene_type:complete